MSAEDRNRELVENNTKELIVPTFNKKEIETIVEEKIKTTKGVEYLYFYLVCETDANSRFVIKKEKDRDAMLDFINSDDLYSKPVYVKIYDTDLDGYYSAICSVYDGEISFRSSRTDYTFYYDEEYDVLYFVANE